MEETSRHEKLVSALRRLILLEIFLIPGLVVALFVEERWFPPEVRAFVAARAEQPLTWLEWLLAGISIPLVILLVTSWFMLWHLRPSGRVLYTVVWAISMVVYFFDPVQVSGGLSLLLTEIAALVAGVILGLIYFSDLRIHFDHGRLPN